MNLKNNAYKISLVSKKNPDENDCHSRLQGAIGGFYFMEVGLPLRGWYEYEDTLKMFFTSDILNITEKEDGNIFIETKNTFYKFEKILEQGELKNEN